MQFGDASNFDLQYNSTSAELEIADRVNNAIASIPTNRSGDLVNGRFSETIAEGKALADSGEVFDSIQAAVNAANSYVRVGPGRFNESVVINIPGFSLVGSGERTVITSKSGGNPIAVASSNVSISNLSVKDTESGLGGIFIQSTTDVSIVNITTSGTDGDAITMNADDSIIANCRCDERINTQAFRSIITNNTIIDSTTIGINTGNGDDCVVSNNIVRGSSRDGINSSSNDGIVLSNRVKGSGSRGISVFGVDTVVANNRITGSTNTAINNSGNGTILDGNLTG
jgi:hypothetical protein